MHKEMESSVFFSIFQFDAVHEISGNEKNGRTGHQAESGRNIIFTEMLGRNSHRDSSHKELGLLHRL